MKIVVNEANNINKITDTLLNFLQIIKIIIIEEIIDNDNVSEILPKVNIKNNR
tara:strand:- start:4 stop:162 length:159 start_codon:yes stop_codon:yes gene_type:complete